MRTPASAQPKAPIRIPVTLILALGIAALLFLSGCADSVTRNDVGDVAVTKAPPAVVDQADSVSRNSPRILAMGDSMMAWHSISKKSIAHEVGISLGEPVTSNAVSGARILYNLPISGAAGLKIASQYRKGDWDWVVLNGGGNDIFLGCGCGACTRKLDKMISEDGKRGAIPMMVQDLRQKGAQVAYVGYLRSPGAWSPIENCRAAGDVLEARISALAMLDRGIHFVSLTDLVPDGDRTFHGADMIHPSVKGSRAIGQRVAAVIRAQDTSR